MRPSKGRLMMFPMLYMFHHILDRIQYFFKIGVVFRWKFRFSQQKKSEIFSYFRERFEEKLKHFVNFRIKSR